MSTAFSKPPPPWGNRRPDGFNYAERPCTLNEAIHRGKRAGDGEGQYKPMAALFQGVADEHRGNCKQAEDCGCVHNLSSFQLAQISGAVVSARQAPSRRPHSEADAMACHTVPYCNFSHPRT